MIRWQHVILALLPAGLAAQTPFDTAGASAAAYLERYKAVLDLAPEPGRVAPVRDLVLQRDVGRLTLEQGTLYLLSTIGGRTVGAVFRGTGYFAFSPPIEARKKRSGN